MFRSRAYVMLLLAAGACSDGGSQGADANMPGENGPAPVLLSLDPQATDFGSTTVGTSSGTQTFTVMNVGDSTSGAISVLLNGADATHFAIAASTCTSTLAPRAACTVSVRFQPLSGGPRSATLIASDGTFVAFANVTGRGMYISDWSITGSPHDFGMVPVGSTDAFTFTVRASDNGTGTITVNTSGANPTNFASSGTCAGAALAPNATCTLTVAFTPSATGPRAATFELRANPGGQLAAAVAGTGVAPSAALTVTPTPWDFGSVRIGDSSFGKMFTINHPSGAPTGPLALSITGTHIGDFIKMADNCTGQSLTAGASCTVFVAFEPGAVGTRSGRLSVAASPGGTVDVDLSGTCTAQ